MDQDERELFAQSVARVFARASADRGGDVDAGLAEIGWRDALAAWGGAAIGVVLGAQGRAGATSGALDDVLGSALGLDEPTAVLLPRLGRQEQPATCGDDDVLSVDGLATPRILGAERAAVVVDGPEGCHVRYVPTSRLTVEPIVGLDPDALLHTVTAVLPAGALAHAPTPDGGAADWSQALALGQLAVAAELVGVGRAMLGLALEHARSRLQFGRPIGSFQAVRHRLADAFVALEGASAAVEACVDATGTGPLVAPGHAAMAKALAGAASRDSAKHAQQVLAGIGFTAEHTFHRHLRRSMLLDRLLGSGRTLTRQVGVDTLAGASVPMDLPL
jgi:alkylation response protein AidB-like acyl-CoA dehydrogenase